MTQDVKTIVSLLTVKQTAVLCLFLDYPVVTRKLLLDVFSDFFHSRAAAWRPLAQLKLMQLIKPIDENKKTKYNLTESGKMVVDYLRTIGE